MAAVACEAMIGDDAVASGATLMLGLARWEGGLSGEVRAALEGSLSAVVAGVLAMLGGDDDAAAGGELTVADDAALMAPACMMCCGKCAEARQTSCRGRRQSVVRPGWKQWWCD